MNSYADLHKSRVGEKHNKLTILGFDSRSKGYEVQCDCGNKLLTKYYRLKNGSVRSCRECFVSSSYGRPMLPDNLGAKRAVRTQYRLGAIRRGLEFTISEDAFFGLMSQPCHYCGLPPSQKVTMTTTSAHDDYRYSGVDREDNSAGYVEGNCVPCCTTCNFSKRDMSLSDWKSWIERLLIHQRNVRDV